MPVRRLKWPRKEEEAVAGRLVGQRRGEGAGEGGDPGRERGREAAGGPTRAGEPEGEVV